MMSPPVSFGIEKLHSRRSKTGRAGAPRPRWVSGPGASRMRPIPASAAMWTHCSRLKNVGIGTTVLPSAVAAMNATIHSTEFSPDIPILCGVPARSAAAPATSCTSSDRETS